MIFIKEDKFILVKIFKSNLENFDIYNKEHIISLFKDIFIKVKKKYDLSGIFDVNIYVNNDYGLIIEIDNVFYNDIDCDVNIKVHLDSIFLIEISNYEILDYNDVYYYNDKFFGFFKNFSDKDIIYKNVDEIIDNGINLYWEEVK